MSRCTAPPAVIAEPYATRHITRFAFGLLLMMCIALVDIRFIARFSWLAYVLGVALLVLVLKIGHVGKGAQRWLDIGGQQIQPSELMKLGLILALAAWFHRANWERIGNPLFLLPAVDRGADSRGADPEGAESRHRDDYGDAGWSDVLRRRGPVVEVRIGAVADPVRRTVMSTTICTIISAPGSIRS